MRTMVRVAALCAWALGLGLADVSGQVASMRMSLPSPTAATLGEFGDVPVSLYTGLPQVSVPLFVAEGRTLELPIRLSYHGGGIRVEEIGGWAGLGWSLEAGGTITRTVRGVVDELSGGYPGRHGCAAAGGGRGTPCAVGRSSSGGTGRIGDCAIVS